MPKAEPAFDARALLTAVQQQDIGLRVSTNDPAGFRRIVYAHMRADESLRCRVYQCPRSKLAFLLTKAAVPTAAAVAEPSPESDDG